MIKKLTRQQIAEKINSGPDGVDKVIEYICSLEKEISFLETTLLELRAEMQVIQAMHRDQR